MKAKWFFHLDDGCVIVMQRFGPHGEVNMRHVLKPGESFRGVTFDALFKRLFQGTIELDE